MVVYVIADIELHDPHGLGQTVGEVHVSRADAEAELAAVLADEPGWAKQLRIIAVDLDGEPLVISLN